MAAFPVKTILSEYTFQGCESFLTPFPLPSCFIALFSTNLNTDFKTINLCFYSRYFSRTIHLENIKHLNNTRIVLKKWERLDKNKPPYYLTKFTAAMSYPSNSRISIIRGKWKTYPIGAHQNIQGIWKEYWGECAEYRTRKWKVAGDPKTEIHNILENWS